MTGPQLSNMCYRKKEQKISNKAKSTMTCLPLSQQRNKSLHFNITQKQNGRQTEGIKHDLAGML